jgi:hypothetical protein
MINWKAKPAEAGAPSGSTGSPLAIPPKLRHSVAPLDHQSHLCLSLANLATWR